MPLSQNAGLNKPPSRKLRHGLTVSKPVIEILSRARTSAHAFVVCRPCPTPAVSAMPSQTPASPAVRTTKLVAVVQAGTSGIGLAVAARLLADGFAVVVSSRRTDNVAAAVAALAPKRGDSPCADVVGIVAHAGVEKDRKLLADAACRLRADGMVCFSLPALSFVSVEAPSSCASMRACVYV
jgi:hypothetical protein